MNARTHQAYLTADLWRALQHVAAVRGVCVEEVLEEMAWGGLNAAYPWLSHIMIKRSNWLKQHDIEVRDSIKKAIESKVKGEV